MKKLTLIIGLSMIINLSAPLAYAVTEPETKCVDKKPNYEELKKLWYEAEVKDQDAYQEAFDAAQLAHHDYVGCMFQFAENTILISDGTDSEGTISSNLLNTGTIPVLGGLVDWLAPDEACLTSEELKKLIQKTDPSQMLTPVIDAHTLYKNFLLEIGKEYDASGTVTGEDGQELRGLDSLRIKQANIGTVKRNRELEIQSSLLAIDLMFTSLKELRFALVMHVHFQCTLKFLNKYRQALEDMRTVVEPLPDQLEDASVTK